MTTWTKSTIAKQLADWIDVDSTTGREGDFAYAMKSALEASGFAVELQQVEPGRFNVMARVDRPEVVFCTHLDTVPPFIPPRIASAQVFGRGACDAKGQALSMLLAAEELMARGERRIGFLLTVGEEIDSAGAAFANEALGADPALRDQWRPQYTIVGEPTGGQFISGHKGIFLAELVGHGVAGHSSNPLGPSAIHELVGCCSRLTQADWGHDPRLGDGSINVGTITGGHAPNVVAPRASAEILVRAVDGPAEVRARIEAHLGEHVTLLEGREQYGPVHFEVPGGEASHPVAFGTDAPHLTRFGKPLLFGPGSIDLAHTDNEHIELADLESAVGRHVQTVETLLAK